MKTRHIVLACSGLAVVLLFCLLAFLLKTRILTFGPKTPEKIVWDFTSGDETWRVGWPAANKDIGYYRTGDFDFTFIRGTKVFHEHAQGFGCMRTGDHISFHVIHFGGLLSAEDAYRKTKQVLVDYSGGLAPPNLSTDSRISLDEWHEQMRNGTYKEPTFCARGLHGGTVIITIHHEHGYDGLQLRCNLAFQ
jgi:hypothetical protein